MTDLFSVTCVLFVGLLTGSSVVEICTSCQKLQQLSIAYIGASSFSSVLCQALPKCKNLKDLRYISCAVLLIRSYVAYSYPTAMDKVIACKDLPDVRRMVLDTKYGQWNQSLVSVIMVMIDVLKPEPDFKVSSHIGTINYNHKRKINGLCRNIQVFTMTMIHVKIRLKVYLWYI